MDCVREELTCSPVQEDSRSGKEPQRLPSASWLRPTRGPGSSSPAENSLILTGLGSGGQTRAPPSAFLGVTLSEGPANLLYCTRESLRVSCFALPHNQDVPSFSLQSLLCKPIAPCVAG